MSVHRSIIFICLGIICIAASFNLGFIVRTNHSFISSLDRGVSDYVVHTNSPSRTGLMQNITHLGDGNIIIYISLISIAVMLIYGAWGLAVLTAFCMYTMNTITSFLKNYFAVPRPLEMFSGAGGYSYPSGHTTAIFMICFMICWFVFTNIKSTKTKSLLIVFFIITALLVGSSRVFLNVHWFSDVIGGIALSVGFGLLIIGLYEVVLRMIRRNQQQF